MFGNSPRGPGREPGHPGEFGDGFEVNFLSCLIHEDSVSGGEAALHEAGFSAAANARMPLEGPDGRVPGSAGPMKIRRRRNLNMRRRTRQHPARNVGRRASEPRRFLSRHCRGRADHLQARQPRRGATKKRFGRKIVEHSDLRLSQIHGLLEVVFQSELNDTSSRGSADPAIERAGQQRGRVRQVDVVEQVEKLRPKLEVRLSRR